jgi:hypothetical protein
MDAEEAKRQAARAAAELVPEQGVVGLGTGSTTRFFIEAVAELVRAGRRLVGVPTSQKSRELASSLGVGLLDDDGPWTIDLCVDGADEVSEALDLIKGGGHCLGNGQSKCLHMGRMNIEIRSTIVLGELLRCGNGWGEPNPIFYHYFIRYRVATNEKHYLASNPLFYSFDSLFEQLEILPRVVPSFGGYE